MPEYIVSVSQRIEADSPEAAAEDAERGLDENTDGWVYGVQEITDDGLPVGAEINIDRG